MGPGVGWAALHRPVVCSAEDRDDPEAGDTALGRAALYIPVIEAIEEGDNLGVAAPCSAALCRP